MKYANPLNLSVKNLKTWNTDDGGGYQFTLYRNSNPVIEVTQGGYGGPLEYRFLSDLGKKTLELINELVKDFAPIQSHGYELKVNDGMYLDELVSEAQFQKKLAKYKKNHICLRLPGDDEYSFRSVKVVSEEQRIAWLPKMKTKYPNAVIL